MARKQPNQESDFVRQVKKFFLSAFVVITFIAYFLHERNTNVAAASPVNTATVPSAVNTAANQCTANTATALPRPIRPQPRHRPHGHAATPGNRL